MVQILPAVPGFGEKLSSVLTQVGTDIGAGIQRRQANKATYAQALEQRGLHAQKALYGLFKQYKDDPAYSADRRQQAEALSQEYVRRGYSPYDAAVAAREDMVRGFPAGGSTMLQKAVGTQSPGAPQEDSRSFLRKTLDLPFSEIVAMPTRKLMEIGKAKNAAMQAEDEAQLQRDKTKQVPDKSIETMSYDEILNLPTDYVRNLPLKEGRKVARRLSEAAQMLTDVAFGKGLDPIGLISRGYSELEKRGISPLPKETEASRTPLALAKLAGEITKDLGLFGLADKAKTMAGKLAAGAGIFGTQQSVKTAVEEGRSPTVGEVAVNALSGALPMAIEPAVRAIMPYIKRIPAFYNSLKAAVKRTKGLVAEEGIVAEAAKNLEERGVIAKEGIQTEAAKNLEERGVSILNMAKGNSVVLNELQKETRAVANTFAKAEKYNQAELSKIRSEKFKKLTQSPLEEYFAPEKVVEHRPATIAKEAERVKPLHAAIAEDEKTLLNLQYKILTAEDSMRMGAKQLSAEEAERVRAVIAANRREHQKILDKIRALTFEIKYGHPPMTPDAIKEQIEKSFKEIRAGIEDPASKKIVAMQKALDRNKKAVETAERLVQRGEIPGPPVFDEFIKIKQEYVGAYDALIKEVKSFIKESGKSEAAADKVANAQNLLKLLEETKAQSQASIINHIDKRKAMKALEGPSGALFKNVLKDVQKDVGAFQKDWTRVKRLRSLEDMKTRSAAKPVFGKPAAAKEPQIIKQAEKPLSEPGRKVEEKFKSGKTTEKESQIIKQAEKPLSEIVGEMGGKFKSGKTTEKDAVKLEHGLVKFLTKIGRGLPQSLATSVVSGTIQSVIEHLSGKKVPMTYISALLVSGGIRTRGLTFAFTNLIHNQVDKLFIDLEADRLRERKNTPEFNKELKRIEEKYSKSRATKILKAIS